MKQRTWREAGIGGNGHWGGQERPLVMTVGEAIATVGEAGRTVAEVETTVKEVGIGVNTGSVNTRKCE